MCILVSQQDKRCSAKLEVDMAPPLSKWRAARRSSRSRASTWRSAYAPLPSKRACGVAELAVKGESMAVDMRAANIKGAYSVAELAVKGDVQDSDTEESHGTTMEDISTDERAAIVEGTEARQGELTIEVGSVSNGLNY